MLRNSGAALALLALFVLGGYSAWLSASEHPSQAPQIQSQQVFERGIGRTPDAVHNQNPSESGEDRLPTSKTKITGTKRGSKGEYDGEETTEFWSIFGHKFKITDSLLALFTFFLFCATTGLWWATRRLVIAADQTAKRQLRAYVTHEIKGWRGVNDGRPMATQIALLAYGQTPARAVKVLGIIEIMPFPLTSGYHLPELWAEFPQSVDVFPGQANNPPVGWITAKRPFTAEELRDITSEYSTKRAYMLGRISYRDIFDEPRETVFRSFLDPKSVQRDDAGKILTFIWAVTEEGNDFR